MYATYHKSRSADGGYLLLNIIRYDVGYLHSLKSWLVASLIMPRKQKKPICSEELLPRTRIVYLLAGVSEVSGNDREGWRLQSHGVQAMQIRLLLDLPHCMGATWLILVS